MLKILPYLKLAVEKNASDLYFTANARPMVRIEGLIHPVGDNMMTGEAVRELAMSILTQEQRQQLAQEKEIDLATEAGGLGRFRVNVFHQRGTVAMALRYVKADVPALDELGLPKVLRELIMLKRGLILMVGATGSGKSTTQAAMIRHRNGRLASHIITIEDPIEFIHPNLKAIITQREVGIDTESYDRALISCLREAPDVIQIGEVRRKSTMDACIQLANVGQLALSTLHANNASQALQRIVNFYPQENRDQLYLDLSLTLRAIVSQRLVRRKDGKRVAAVEVMMNTPFIQELIASARIDDIKAAMEQSSDGGTQTFDQSLLSLYRDGQIELEEALSNADSRTNLEARINFGT